MAADKPHDFIDQYQAIVRDGLEAWSRQFDPAGQTSAATPSADIAGRLFAGLSGYGDWLRSVMGGELPTPPFATADASPFGGGMPPFGSPGPGMPPFGYGPPPGTEAGPGTAQFDDWARRAREQLSMPAFGLTREQQEEQQALLRAWIDYAEYYGRYQELLRGVQDRATAALREQSPPTDAESMRSVYDRWVNLAEESYAEAALSEEFQEVYASLVNAQMRLKVLQQRQVERFAVQAGLPSRKEVDSLGERLQAVRRELRQMQGLAAEVKALRARVAALEGGEPAVKASVGKASRPKGPRASSAGRVAKAANRAGEMKAVVKTPASSKVRQGKTATKKTTPAKAAGAKTPARKTSRAGKR